MKTKPCEYCGKPINQEIMVGGEPVLAPCLVCDECNESDTCHPWLIQMSVLQAITMSEILNDMGFKVTASECTCGHWHVRPK